MFIANAAPRLNIRRSMRPSGLCSRPPVCWYRNLSFVTACLTLLIAPMQLVAAPAQALDDIRSAAEQHLLDSLHRTAQGTVTAKATSLDNRLRLAPCTVPLEAFLPNGANIGSRATVGVRCSSGNGWTVYVPVDIESEVTVLRLNKALARDAQVTGGDVEVTRERVPGLGSAYLDSVADLKGMRLKRALPGGSLLTPALLQAEAIIRRGQQVILLASVAGIEVRNQGIALADAGAHDRVKVRNLASAKVVEGVVDPSGVVNIAL